jgi:hypothetical protein
VKQTSSRTALSHSRLFVTNQFIVAAEKSRMAASETAETQIVCAHESTPIRRMAGLKMKTKGRMAVRNE